jgi:hypothetical protein
MDNAKLAEVDMRGSDSPMKFGDYSIECSQFDPSMIPRSGAELRIMALGRYARWIKGPVAICPTKSKRNNRFSDLKKEKG